MKVQSFISENNRLVPIQVEISLWPGLPGIQFLGRPDPHLKESALRIKSAIRAQGFQFPTSSQILVNLRPSHVKKTSRGVELAVAAGLLWLTEQVQAPILDQQTYIYGELSLDGQVYEPEDLGSELNARVHCVYTGKSQEEQARGFRRLSLTDLAHLNNPDELPACERPEFKRPQDFLDFQFTEEQAELMKILAVGEHHALIAGPAGSGKTTLSRAVHQFLREPKQSLSTLSKSAAWGLGDELWRPLIKPHHSTPMISMIGGGASPVLGEIAYAHGGVLLLDELLEFPQVVRESLREPMEEARMRVFRLGKALEYKLDAQILATTNLCPCGDLTPDPYSSSRCGFSKNRCHVYLPKLSGPFVDRFDVLHFMQKPKSRGKYISGQKILDELLQVYKFQSEHKHRPAKYWSLESLMGSLPAFERETLQSMQWTSHRRLLATLKVARTLADLQFCTQMGSEHVLAAEKYTKQTFDALRKMA